jgi:hypothetical protein
MWIPDFANDCFLDSDVSEIPVLTVLETAEEAICFSFWQYCFKNTYDNNQLFLQVSLTQIDKSYQFQIETQVSGN